MSRKPMSKWPISESRCCDTKQEYHPLDSEVRSLVIYISTLFSESRLLSYDFAIHSVTSPAKRPDNAGLSDDWFLPQSEDISARRD
jgi:hypothetical protein